MLRNATVGELLGLMDIRAPGKSSKKLVNSSKALGLEVEVENANLPLSNLRYWLTVRDGSLRNNGLEYIFKNPCKGDAIVNALKELCSHLGNTDAEVTSRCGVHIHLDVTTCRITKLTRLIYLLTVLEPVLIDITGKRWGNHYCRPSIRLDDVLNTITNLILSPYATESLTQLTRLSKHTAISYAALSRYGTIECRFFESSIDYDTLLYYCNLILAIDKYANKKYTPSKFLEKMRNTSIEDLLADVFGTMPMHLAHDTLYDSMKVHAALCERINLVERELDEDSPIITMRQKYLKHNNKLKAVESLSFDDALFRHHNVMFDRGY